MMKKSQRLKVIVDLNAENEKKALIDLGVAQNKKKELQQQLDGLQSYLQEYKDKYQKITNSGINITQLLEFRAFINKLEKAIEEQQQAVFEMDSKATVAKKSWERQHQKTKSLQKVCASAKAEELKVENKKEQTEQDERAMRGSQNGGTGNAN